MTCHVKVYALMFLGSRSPPIGHAKLLVWGRAMDDSIPIEVGRGEEALAIQTCLQRFGLVGSKLAVSYGSEEVLTKQLVEHLKLRPKDWHGDFVKAQVAAEKEMQDLELRL